MKTIGFIDYYLDEWHANEYPKRIAELSDGAYQVRYAYGKIDSPIGGMTNREWAQQHGVELLDTPEEVVAKSDCVMVLSPDNPERHEALCEAPLSSGKCVFVDKTFAPDTAAALRMFARAEAHGTPCFSSSALRFSEEIAGIEATAVYRVYSEGPGLVDGYSVHQLEQIVALMNARPVRVMALGDAAHPSFVIAFEDGRTAQMVHRGKWDPFALTTVDAGNGAKRYDIRSDYFKYLLLTILNFFDTGHVPVPHEQTVAVMAIREAALHAQDTPFEWVTI